MARTKKIEVDEVEEAVKAVEEAVVEAAPVEEAVKFKERKCVLGGNACVMSIRKVGSFLFYNDGLKMVRLPIAKDKPITVTIGQ